MLTTAKRIVPTILLALFSLCLPAVAEAQFGVVPGSFTAKYSGPGIGGEETRAGAHPDDATFEFSLNKTAGAESTDGRLKDAIVDLPPGLLGNPQAVRTCPLDIFYVLPSLNEFDERCPLGSQVGTVDLETVVLPNFPPVENVVPLFNLPTGGGTATRLGFQASTAMIVLTASVRPGDYGISVRSTDTNAAFYYPRIKTTVWGVPASPLHDGERPCPNYEAGCFQEIDLPEVPYLTNATRCGDANVTGLRVSSWEEPTDYLNYSFATPSPLSECNRLPFAPSLRTSVDSSAAGSPAGMTVDLDLPQDGLLDPEGIATAHVRKVTVTLPQGVAVNAASADGLGGCSPDQIQLGSSAPIACPESSELGTVQIQTPLLDHPIDGGVYLATSGDNPFGSLLALYVVADDPKDGILLKLPGRVAPNSETGQLTVTFDDNPQLPFESLHMELKAGPRAALQLPDTCGTYTTNYTFTSWAGQGASGQSSFTIDQNCSASSQFTPGFQAGTTNPVGGGFSPFVLRVTRQDAEQSVSRIQATLPEGVLAKLAGVPLCGDAQAATGNCPSASQIGSATVGVGAGPNPLYVPQPGKAPTAIYLAGPYKGAPYSLVAKVPAQAGPFDLGTVSVRNAIDIDPTTAQVSVKSDPLPQILQGIPIAYRDIRVTVDRPDFTLNPTNCDPMEVKGTIGSAEGKSANVSDRFQVASCERLSFKPKLALSVKGATHRNAHPAFKAVLTMPKGGANIQKAQVTLPKTELLENAHIRTICTRVQYAAQGGGGKACPPASIYGKAKAWTPLLDKPLEGPVYLRSSSHQLPDLVASLDGQIHIDLVGRIDAKNARIRNTFEAVPDAPVSRFVLEMQGGKKGLLANNTELCKTIPRASVKFDGQNGKLADSNPVMRADCGKKARKGGKKRGGRR